jgi:hypothetical protein
MFLPLNIARFANLNAVYIDSPKLKCTLHKAFLEKLYSVTILGFFMFVLYKIAVFNLRGN